MDTISDKIVHKMYQWLVGGKLDSRWNDLLPELPFLFHVYILGKFLPCSHNSS